MKKLLGVLCVVLFVLVGCGGVDDSATIPSQTNDPLQNESIASVIKADFAQVYELDTETFTASQAGSRIYVDQAGLYITSPEMKVEDLYQTLHAPLSSTAETTQWASGFFPNLGPIQTIEAESSTIKIVYTSGWTVVYKNSWDEGLEVMISGPYRAISVAISTSNLDLTQDGEAISCSYAGKTLLDLRGDVEINGNTILTTPNQYGESRFIILSKIAPYAFGFAIGNILGVVGGDSERAVVISAWQRPTAQHVNVGKIFAFKFDVFTQTWIYQWSYNSPIDADDVEFGYAITTGSPLDMDNDGDAKEFAVSMPGYNASTGRVYVFKDATYSTPPTICTYVTGTQTGEHFGNSISLLDMVLDYPYTTGLLVGAEQYNYSIFADVGRVYFFTGNRSSTCIPATASWTDRGTQSDEHFGHVVIEVGDTDMSGLHSGFLVTAPNHTGTYSQGGRVTYYHYGTPLTAPKEAWYDDGQATAAHLGWSAISLGKTDTDAYIDIAAGAPDYDASSPTRVDSGLVCVYHGNSKGTFEPCVVVKAKRPSGSDDQVANAHFGYAINGTKYGINLNGSNAMSAIGKDLIVSAPWYIISGSITGRIYGFLGGNLTTPNPPSYWTWDASVNGEQMGESMHALPGCCSSHPEACWFAGAPNIGKVEWFADDAYQGMIDQPYVP